MVDYLHHFEASLAALKNKRRYRSFANLERQVGRHPRARDKHAVREDGRPAVTHWQVLERFEGVESLAEDRRLDVHTAGLEVLDGLWSEVKQSEK